jgi:hypothetical protein
MGLFIVASLLAFFFYTKFEQSEKEYVKLHEEYLKVVRDREKTKRRVKDLQSYKDDISKTFKILDNELAMINDHIKRKDSQNETSDVLGELRGNNLSVMLTPEILSGFFDGINTERVNEEVDERSGEEVEGGVEKRGQIRGIEGVINRYDEFLI